MLTHLEDLNLDFFYELLHSLKIEVLELLAPLNLISRKVWMTEKSWNFHNVILKKIIPIVGPFHKAKGVPAFIASSSSSCLFFFRRSKSPLGPLPPPLPLPPPEPEVMPPRPWLILSEVGNSSYRPVDMCNWWWPPCKNPPVRLAELGIGPETCGLPNKLGLGDPGLLPWGPPTLRCFSFLPKMRPKVDLTLFFLPKCVLAGNVLVMRLP